MKFILRPWHRFLLIAASWVHREQQLRIEYLQTEVAVLKKQIGNRRILLTNDQRRRLARQGQNDRSQGSRGGWFSDELLDPGNVSTGVSIF